MTTFKYKAVSWNGADITGVVEAYDKFDAVAKIKENCSVVTEVTEVGAAPGKDIDFLFGGLKITQKELSLMCRQFSIILEAGLPLVRTVELVAAQSNKRAVKKMLEQVADDVASGSALSSSFQNRGKQLPATFIETIRAGEQSGALDNAFTRLAEYFGKTADTKQKVTSALIYPVFVIAVAIIVMAVIIIFAVPQFSSAFESIGTELPLLTRTVLAVSGFFTKYIFIILFLLVVSVLTVKFYSKTENGAVKTAAFIIGLPVVGRIAELSNASQFASTMSTMLAAGLPATSALTITGRSMTNRYMGGAVLRCVPAIESGKRIGDAMRDEPGIPQLLTEMTALGEESGTLEDTLAVISRYYDNEAATATSRALSLLEPLIIVLLAVFVVLILLSVYMPIFGMYDGGF